MLFRFKLMSQIQLEELESNARTFGELKRDIQNSHLADKIVFDKTVVQRDGKDWVSTIKLFDNLIRSEYGSDDSAILPQGDKVIFFVMPFEHKGGQFDEGVVQDIFSFIEDMTMKEFLDKIEELGYNELRSLGSKLNSKYKDDCYFPIDLYGRRGDILSSIREWSEDFLGFKNEENEEENSYIYNLEKAIEYIKEAMEIGVVSCNNLVDNLTLEELHKQALELQRKVNA